MIVIFYIFASALIFFSYRSFRGGIDYLGYFRSELARPRSTYTPFATIIVPCRGLDQGLRENLLRLFEQEHPAYEIIFVVDDVHDAAASVIEELLGKAGDGLARAKLVVAPKADGSSQKVENLREAVLHADPRSEVFVFADSDARPSREWLSRLVAPLEDPQIGASTGYRWLISERPTFASEMRSAWNASIASALGANLKSNFCWGGSMAIRRETFERLNIRERWRGTLSDDFAMTRAIKEAGLAIYFVPQALAASIENCAFGEMIEFTTRQMKITRVYAPHLWRSSFFGAGLYTVVMSTALLIVILSGQNNFAVYFSLATIGLVSVFSTGKSWLRLRAVKLALKEFSRELRLQNFTQNTLWPLAPPLFLFNAIAAAFSRRMTWRGIKYKLNSPTETVIITD